MQLLKDKIIQEGVLLDGDILKVDCFLNHQVDPVLMDAMGQDFYNHYRDQGINKILTLEVSGIAIAIATAFYFKVPMVFAKKTQSLTLDDQVYSSNVYSYTKEQHYEIRVAKDFLTHQDRVLIIDDFLANGQALMGLIDLCDQAGAEVAGVGIAIEKAFQKGGDLVRAAGYPVYSQAVIASFDKEQVNFA